MLRVARKALPLGLLLVVFAQGTAFAANVSIVDNAFSPSTTTLAPGGSVLWTRTGSNPHTTTSDSSTVWPWDSGTLAQNGTFSKSFPAAGSFPYHCNIHTFMHGTVDVLVQVSPTSGTHGVTQFTLTWASGSIPSGYNVDVQYSRNGGAWTNIAAFQNRTGNQVSATATAPSAGDYQLRARLQLGTGSATAYSPPSVTVHVT